LIGEIEAQIKQLGLEKIMKTLTVAEENASSAVCEDTLLHLEALLVVTSGDSEDVALELFTHDLTIDLLAHSSIVEGTAKCKESVKINLSTRANSQLGLVGLLKHNQILTCTFHRQFQSFFDHLWWDRQC
jgi:hypothetical protein